MSATQSGSFGDLLRYWRNARKMSQLAVAVEAEVSTRHVSFVETGKSTPSRDMVLLLADVLEVPLRDRNTLLQAAGYAPAYRETSLDAPELRDVRRGIEFMLEHHNPYPAILVDRHWNLLLQNRAASALFPLFVADASALTTPLNTMRLLFDPRGFRPFITNWEEIAVAMVQRLHAEVALTQDATLRQLLEELLSADDVPKAWRVPDYGAERPLLVSTRLRRGTEELELYTALTTLGTPLDITLHELRLETFFAANEATDRAIRRLVAS
ncbi:MAG: helix-turn-helix transcriptional regulator [Polyangiaceae bacterium]